MKRLTAWLLVCVLLLTGCAPKTATMGMLVTGQPVWQ